MPKRCQAAPTLPIPLPGSPDPQLPLFAEQALLIRMRPERNEWRFYRMEVWPDLFGRALPARQWGRIGTQCRIRLEPHPDPASPSTLSPVSPGKSAAAATRTAPHDQAADKPGAKTGKAPSPSSRPVPAKAGAEALPPHLRQGARRLPGPGKHMPAGAPSRQQVPSPAPAGVALHTADGARKYLTACEHDAFLRATERADRSVRTLCMTLAYAGCRLSEALALTADRVELAPGVLVFESLKKRRSGIFRSVPVPPALLEALDLVHGIRELQCRRGKGRGRSAHDRAAGVGTNSRFSLRSIAIYTPVTEVARCGCSSQAKKPTS